MKLKLKERDIFQCFLKVFFVMRITLFFILVSSMFAFSINGYSQNAKLSLNLRNVSVSHVLKAIEEQSEFIFFYQDQQVDLNRNINIIIVDKPVNEILDQLFEGSDNVYKINDRQIIIGKSQELSKTITQPVERIFQEEVQQPKTKTLNGKVTDTKGESIPGTTILIKGTTIGTISDIDGKFTFNVPLDAKTLTFSFVGMKTLEIQMGEETTFTVSLEEMTIGIGELVVVGYGTQKKETVTGSVASVGNKELLQSPVSNISNALVGRIVGLTALQSSGEPGDDAATIMIRGVSTLNSSGQSPLVIIDGVESSFSILNAVDANEIENVSVLKDASATAVYGVRGANGVIILTTKRGKSGSPKINFSSNFGFTELTSKLKMLGSYEYAKYKNEAIRYDNDPSLNDYLFTDDEIWKFQNNRDYTPTEVESMNITPAQKATLLAQPALYYGSHDYFEEQYGGTAPQQQYNLNISGGGDRVRYFTSLGYFSQAGLFNDSGYGGADINSFYKRYNFRSNYDIDVTKNLKISAGLSGQFATNGGILGSSADGDITQSYSRHKAMMVAILDGPPYVGPGIIDGKLVNGYVSFTNPLEAKAGWGSSPVGNLLLRPYLTTINTNLNANIKVTHTLDYLTKGLSVTGTVSYNDTYIKSVYRTQPIPTYSVTRNPDNPSEILFYGGSVGAASITDNYKNYKRRQEYYELATNYKREFGKHAVTGLVLVNAQKKYDPSYLYNVPSGLIGMASRATYSFDERYLAEVDMGYNGSENFPEGSRFGFFPAFSAGWIISNEPLFPKSDIVSWLKVRGSYGEVGNDQIGGNRFLYLPSTWGYGGDYAYGGYSFGNTNGGSKDPFYSGAYESTVGNPFVTWERAKKANIGFEINFFKNRLTFVGDIFQEKRDNILWSLGTVPSIVGASLPKANIGKVTNKGYEIQLGWNDRIGKVAYSIKSNVAYAKNNIEYMDEPAYPYDWMNETGFSLGQFKGLDANGFYNTNEEALNRPYSNIDGNHVQPGDIRYTDINGDGVIDSKDKVPIGYSNMPRYSFNSTLNIGYKGFNVSALFIGTAQGSFPIASLYLLNPFYMNAGTAEQFQYYGRWTPEKAAQGIDPTFPRASMRTYSSQNGTFNDLWLKSSDFIRLKNIEVSYTFKNTGLLKRAGINALRIYCTGNNLYTWTNLMDGLDPEQQNSGGASDGYLYPMVRTYSFGVNIQL